MHKNGRVVYPPLPSCHSKALKTCIRVLERLGFRGDAAHTSTLGEKLVKLARDEYDMDMLSLTQHYDNPGVVVDTSSFFQDL